MITSCAPARALQTTYSPCWSALDSASASALPKSIPSLPRSPGGAHALALIRYTRDRGRFQDLLEVIKFICKDFWTEVFRKQIDNLRTNHKGVYVLADNKFRLFAHMSPTISKARPRLPRTPGPYCSLCRRWPPTTRCSAVASSAVPWQTSALPALSRLKSRCTPPVRCLVPNLYAPGDRPTQVASPSR